MIILININYLKLHIIFATNTYYFGTSKVIKMIKIMDFTIKILKWDNRLAVQKVE